SEDKLHDTDKIRVPDRNRHRLRLRVGLKAEVNPMMDAVVRIASGVGQPVSTNQDLTDAFSEKDLWIDRAYMDYHPRKWLSARAGKQGVPFEKTDLVWDSDVNVEGISILPNYEVPGGELFFRAGGFWAEEHTTGGGQGMLGGQIGTEQKSGKFSGQVAVAYYDWLHVKNGPLLYSADKSYGNNSHVENEIKLYRSDFNLLDVTALLATKSKRMEITVNGNFVMNSGAVEDPETNEKHDNGWLAGVAISLPECPLDWELGWNYRDLQADATIGAFTDSDHAGGGTNFCGHGFSLALTPMPNTRLGGNLMLDTKDPDGGKLAYRRLQIDLAVSF
ncbi:putative porin, partial [bacterium]|nr:putative porin [bacterium]